MKRFLTSIALACLMLSAAAAELPGKGKLLVATDVVGGGVFNETVILLLDYSADGAAGLVINRPAGPVPPGMVAEFPALQRYDGPLYWGGPVEQFTMRALLKSATPPDEAMPVIGDIYLVPVRESLLDVASDAESLRFFVGYSGWSPGQLDRELARGSWHVAAATDETVFPDDVDRLWNRLLPPPVRRVFADPAGSAGGDGRRPSAD